jgi:hypothetical protein
MFSAKVQSYGVNMKEVSNVLLSGYNQINFEEIHKWYKHSIKFQGIDSVYICAMMLFVDGLKIVAQE